MGKFNNLANAINDICEDYSKCKDCPLMKKVSPYTYESLCDMLVKAIREKYKEEKENE